MKRGIQFGQLDVPAVAEGQRLGQNPPGAARGQAKHLLRMATARGKELENRTLLQSRSGDVLLHIIQKPARLPQEHPPWNGRRRSQEPSAAWLSSRFEAKFPATVVRITPQFTAECFFPFSRVFGG